MLFEMTTELDQDEINLRIGNLARQYGKTPPGDPRRAEIANEFSELCLILHRVHTEER
jgi:hypothetical protein